MRPPGQFWVDPTLGPLLRDFVRRINSIAMPPGTRLSDWYRSAHANEVAQGRDYSQHLAGLSADFVTSNPRSLVAAFTRAGLTAIYHNVGSGWHVHVQAYPAGFLRRLLEHSPRLARLLGVSRTQRAPTPAYVVPYSTRSTST